MITNFEEITYDITEPEKRASRYVERILRSQNKYFNNTEISTMIFNASGKLKEFDYKDARIRKIINYLRLTTAPNIVASSKGYKVSNNIEELTKYHLSLMERIDAINNIAIQTETYLNSIKNA
jgi:hypothetical protein